ncbi:hypothetical protein [Streptomyces violascens]|uniref:hypothetical protein n=1 Tax=Streptomyces violascens TaxID=67381 RepID=UPI001675E67F|nr:hypothetical protein [Streptomyces violascens]GGU40414.1 hypothetical protein GCM10010289_71550 [Streptomyces violascens]
MNTSVWVAESVPARLVFEGQETAGDALSAPVVVLRHRARKSAARAMAHHLYVLGSRRPELKAMVQAAGDMFAASASCDPASAPVLCINGRVYRLRQETEPAADA